MSKRFTPVAPRSAAPKLPVKAKVQNFKTDARASDKYVGGVILQDRAGNRFANINVHAPTWANHQVVKLVADVRKSLDADKLPAVVHGDMNGEVTGAFTDRTGLVGGLNGQLMSSADKTHLSVGSGKSAGNALTADVIILVP